MCQARSQISEFLFVEPKYARECFVCDDISSSVKKELNQTGFFRGWLYPANIPTTDFAAYKSQGANYILRSEVKKVFGTDNYIITFRLDSIHDDTNSMEFLHRIQWNNNEYFISKNYKSDNSLEDIIILVMEDLEHFEAHKEFKVRVKVDEFEEPVEQINSEEFSSWLAQILNRHDIIKQKYVVYFKDEMYPDDLDDRFYGRFRDARPPNDDLLKVMINIVINRVEKYCEVVVIHSDDYRTDKVYQDTILNVILNKLDLN
jgi:hypothetical protein